LGRGKPRTCEVCSVEYRPTYGDQRTCSRACGIALRRIEHGTAGSKPPGRNCRRCGKRSESVTSHGKRCAECSSTRSAIRVCDECGATFAPTNAVQKRCSAKCADRANRRNIIANITRRYKNDPAFRAKVSAAAHNRRASLLGAGQITGQADLIAYLMKRDRGRCGICHKPVRARKGPMRPSVDHIVPLLPINGERGSHALENLQLAHYRCNLSKGNRGGGEQLMLIG